MIQIPQIQAVLRRTDRAWRWTQLLASGGLVLAGVLAAASIGVLVDAALGLSKAGLIAVDSVIIGLLCGGVGWIAIQVARGRLDPRRVARLLEERLGFRDSRLINAVEFAGGAADFGSVALREAAVHRADVAWGAIQPRRVIDGPRLKRSARALLLAGALIALLGLLTPRLLAMGAARLLNPGADLPPFTLIRFEIATEPQRIYFGKSATIVARLTGPFAPDTADVVFIDGSHRERIAMHRQEPGTFLLPIDRVEGSRWFYIDTPRGRSYGQELSVLPVPLFESMAVRYEYPAYTRWPSTERTLDDSGLAVLIGTRVTLTLGSNLPLREGRIAIRGDSPGTDGVTISLAPGENPRIVRGSFELSGNGGYELSLIAADGTLSEARPRGPIAVTLDRPPTVQLMSPDLRSAAPEGWKAPVNVSASDDIGFGKIVLHQRVNDRPGKSSELTLVLPRPDYATATTQIDLAELGAKAGDIVRGFATAYDNHPDPANSGDSPTFEVKVLTAEQYKELARQEYALAELLAELEGFNADRQRLEHNRQELAEKLKELEKRAADSGGTLTEAQNKQLEELRKQIDDYAREMQDLSQRLSERAQQMPLYSFEPPVHKQLKQIAQRISEQAASAGRAAAGLSASAPNFQVAMEQLNKGRDLEQDQAGRQPTEQQLAKLELADRLMAEGDQVIAIADQQKDLAERMSTFQADRKLTADDAARLKGLASEQQQLKAALSDSLDRMQQAAGEAQQQLPRMSSSARELVEKIRRDLRVENDQADAVSHAQASRGARAHKSADSAARKLQSLIGQCKGMGDCASDDLDGLLELTRSQISAALGELSGARRGRGMGSGYGGASSLGGSGFGAVGTQPGGAPSRATLLGPHSRSASGRPTARLNLRTGAYNAQGAGFGQGAIENPEVLDPGQTSGDRHVGGGPPGVPLQYRTLAEQYFRRLAEDTKAGAK